MIKLITFNSNYRAITLDYTDGTWMTIRLAADEKYHGFLANCEKFCKCIHSRDNGWIKVFEF